MEETLVSFDLETTGLDPKEAAIIEIGAVKFRGSKVVDKYQTLVNPLRPLPLSVQVLTGITPEELKTAPPIQNVISSLASFIQGHRLVGHTLSFDLGFLEAAGLMLSNKVYDTFDLASLLLPDAPDLSLSAVSTAMQAQVLPGHRALRDAEAAMFVLEALKQIAQRLPPGVIAECLRLTEHTEWSFRDLFLDIHHNMGPLSGHPFSDGITGMLLPFASEDKWSGYPSLAATHKGFLLDTSQITSILESGGALSKGFINYEFRKEQALMTAAVARAFNEARHLVVEAGTGTGKSIAYLLPASHFALQNETRVVISSNTISLQEQLVNKDIPDLMRCLGWSFDTLRVAPLKGRTNYLCLRRWNHLRQSSDLSSEEVRLLLRTLIWLGTTTSGDRTELRLLQNEMAIWSKMCSQEDNCLGSKCYLNQKGYCFLYRARKRAEKAHLIVTNHALTLSDLAVGNKVIPEYRYLIIDEAHHLEEEATSQFGFTITEAIILEYLNRVSRRLGGGIYSGLLAEIKSKIRTVRAQRRKEIGQLIDDLQYAVESCRKSIKDFFSQLVEFLRLQGTDTGDFELRLRLAFALRKSSGWYEVQRSVEAALNELRQLENGLSKLHSLLQDLAISPFAGYEDVLADVVSYVHTSQELSQGLKSAVSQPENGVIYWVVYNRENNAASLCSAPQHVGTLLQKHLLSQKDCIILTGATLSTDGNFNFIRNRLGFDKAEELIVGSPFDYLKSTLLFLPKDMPGPDRPGYQQEMERILIDACRASKGRTLVLFTSHNALRNTYRSIKTPLEKENILILGQGIDGSPKKLLDTFKTNEQTVLLGTSSFWEGVDVVGKALSVLIIARLPFAVPTDPIISARSEEYADPFYEYMVPQSIIKFKQGFGRLIRSSSDRGVVVVLDSRLQNKPYGQTFLHSLPPCQLKIGMSRQLPEEIKNWLGQY